MDFHPVQTFKFNMENEEGQLVVKGEINGESEITSLDDLKFKAIIALLNSIDKQSFSKSGQDPLFYRSIEEIEETMNEMKKYDQFQGKTNLRGSH